MGAPVREASCKTKRIEGDDAPASGSMGLMAEHGVPTTHCSSLLNRPRCSASTHLDRPDSWLAPGSPRGFFSVRDVGSARYCASKVTRMTTENKIDLLRASGR